jgi:hypothetical protein
MTFDILPPELVKSIILCLNKIIKGCMHRLMQRLKLPLFPKKNTSATYKKMKISTNIHG